MLFKLTQRSRFTLWAWPVNTNRRAFCMRIHQYGPLKCYRGIFCELFTFTTSICRLFSRAEWRILGATFHRRVLQGIEVILRWNKVLLYPRYHPWEESLTFRKTVHRRQDGGWMLLQPNISRKFFVLLIHKCRVIKRQ